jgi:carboxyl-terminal processing protease
MATNSKPFNFQNPLLYAGIIAIGMFCGYKLHDTLRFKEKNSASGNVDEILQLVKDRYVDSVATDSVEIKAIENLLAQLDPHSVYIPPSDIKGVNDEMDGEFEGVGIEYVVQKDTLMITSVISGGPSEEAGLQSGDKIYKANDSIIAGKKLSSEAITKNLRGRSGTKVKVSILRGKKDIQNITITRGKIPMYSVDAAYMLTPSVGYIKINRFAENTYDEFIQKMQVLQKAGMEQLVIDVRDNPGGYLEICVKIADELIGGKEKIVYTRSREGKMETYNAKAKGMWENKKVIVLVDEGSASASEVLSGSLQDYDRATIIGRRTFGKGLVQEQYPLSNGGALRLTIARYYIPSGRCIQKDYSKGLEAYENDVIDRFHKGELVSQDSISQKDSTVYKTMAGRTVYGGGGITPDVFVPLESNSYGKNLSAMIGTGYLGEIVNEYFAVQKSTLQANYKSIDDFILRYKPEASLVNNFITQCKADKIETALNEADKKFINNRIASQLAKGLFGNEAQFKVLNKNDNMIEAALKAAATK